MYLSPKIFYFIFMTNYFDIRSNLDNDGRFYNISRNSDCT